MTQDPHAEARAKIFAEAKETRRYADSLWERGKKERSSQEHARAAQLEDLACEPDLPAALARCRAKNHKDYATLVALGLIERIP